MSPLHWAAVKGSSPCIKHLLEAGADLDAREEGGKTARDMADELKGSVPFTRGLQEAGYSSIGSKKLPKFSEVSSSAVTCFIQLTFSSAQYEHDHLRPPHHRSLCHFQNL